MAEEADVEVSSEGRGTPAYQANIQANRRRGVCRSKSTVHLLPLVAGECDESYNERLRMREGGTHVPWCFHHQLYIIKQDIYK